MKKQKFKEFVKQLKEDVKTTYEMFNEVGGDYVSNPLLLTEEQINYYRANKERIEDLIEKTISECWGYEFKYVFLDWDKKKKRYNLCIDK